MGQNVMSWKIADRNKPWGFYIKDEKDGEQEYNNFLKTKKEEIKEYAQNLVAYSLDLKKEDKKHLNKQLKNKEVKIKFLLSKYLSQAFKIEKSLIKDIKTVTKENNSLEAIISIPEIDFNNNDFDFKLINKEMEQYKAQFNKFFVSFYFDVKNNGKQINKDYLLKNLEIDEYNNIKDNYENFLKILHSVSLHGGFNNDGFQVNDNSSLSVRKEFIEKLLYKNIVLNIKEKIKNNKNEKIERENLIEKISDNVIKTYEKKINDFIKECNNNGFYKELEKEIEEVKNKLNNFDNYYKYIAKFFLIEIKRKIKNFSLKDKATIERIVYNKNNWDSFYKELANTKYTLEESTFVRKSIDKTISYSYVFTTFKGDYGEQITRVLNKHKGIDTEGRGASSSNKSIMGDIQSGVDEVITINGRKYGIQDKELKEFNKYLYFDELVLKKEKNLDKYIQILSADSIKSLVSLTELSVNNIDTTESYIEQILSKIDYGDLRAVTYESIQNKIFEDLEKKDIIYTPLYKITGQFVPASYLLFKRYSMYLQNGRVGKGYDPKKGNYKKIIKRQLMYLDDIDEELIKKELKNYNKIHELSVPEIQNNLAALTISTEM